MADSPPLLDGRWLALAAVGAAAWLGGRGGSGLRTLVPAVTYTLFTSQSMEARSIKAYLPYLSGTGGVDHLVEPARRQVTQLLWELSREIQRDLARQGHKGVRIPSPAFERVVAWWNSDEKRVEIEGWLGMSEYPDEVAMGPSIDKFFVENHITVID